MSKYLRFWALAEILVEYPKGVRRSFLLREIFQGQTNELNYYEDLSIISFYPVTGDTVNSAMIFEEMHLTQPIESVL